MVTAKFFRNAWEAKHTPEAIRNPKSYALFAFVLFPLTNRLDLRLDYRL